MTWTGQTKILPSNLIEERLTFTFSSIKIAIIVIVALNAASQTIAVSTWTSTSLAYSCLRLTCIISRIAQTNLIIDI
jgi:hypothetical protein